MINYSNSFLFRSKCRWCFSPPVSSKNFSGIYLGIKDLIKELKSMEIDLYLINLKTIESYLKFTRDQKISINVYSYPLFNGVDVKFHKRKKIKKSYSLNEDCIPKISRCKCRKSYWISYDISKELYSEYNKKSKYKYKI